MSSMQVYVVSAEESIFSGKAEYLILSGDVGQLGIYPKHAPLITRIKPGTVRIKVENVGPEEIFYVAGGILEIHPNAVTVLADSIVRAADLDAAMAADARREAQEAVVNVKSDINFARAQGEFAAMAEQIASISKLLKRL
ncbi:MAG: F0F1 ATP synthase subunit epsilon [Magnetococcales bacterium]|nr:F0F1 ATP synthase subunit epsilon [Magnetococcales bacterium]